MTPPKSSWGQIGIVHSTGFRSLLYNEKANVLVAHMYRKGKSNTFFNHLYIRSPEEEKYQPLTDPLIDMNYEYPISNICGRR